MVEILSRGEKPADRTYTTTCQNCTSELRFKASEATETFDQRDGDYVSVDCPVCAHRANVAKHGYDRPSTLGSLRKREPNWSA